MGFQSRIDRAPGVGAPGTEEEAGESVVDFSRVHTASDLITALDAMFEAEQTLTSDSGPVDASQLTRAFIAVWDEAVRLRSVLRKTGSGQRSPQLDESVLRRHLLDFGIIPAGGFQDAIVRIVNAVQVEGMNRSDFEAKDRILEEGRAHPLWNMPPEEFVQTYPEDVYGESAMDEHDDEHLQATARWMEIRAARGRTEVRTRRQETKEWEKGRTGRELDTRDIVVPHLINQAKYQDAIAIAEAGSAEFDSQQGGGDDNVIYHTPGRSSSIAARVQSELAVGLGQDEYRRHVGLMHEIDPQAVGVSKKRMARSIEVPIRDTDAYITLVLISRVENRQFGEIESPGHFIGVAVESIGGVPMLRRSSEQQVAGLSDKRLPKTDAEVMAYDAAMSQLHEVEARVRATMGIDLELTTYLNQSFRPVE